MRRAGLAAEAGNDAWGHDAKGKVRARAVEEATKRPVIGSPLVPRSAEDRPT